MKPIAFLLTALLLAGCGKHDAADREVLKQLDGLKSELKNQQNQPVRWATANKREIESAINEWGRAKADEAKEKETLTHKQKDDLHNYETLQNELNQKRGYGSFFPGRPFASAIDPQTGRPVASEESDAVKALSQQVDEARALVDDILQHRYQIERQYNNQYNVEELVAEYAKDRFDLVVDSSEASFNRSSVLYSHVGESLDITEGVIKLFKEKISK
jgi:hypothetical protein